MKLLASTLNIRLNIGLNLGLAIAFSAATLAIAQGPAPANRLGDGPWTYSPAEKNTRIKVSVVARGLSHPWGIAFLPDGSLMVTEREGRVRLFKNGALVPGSLADLTSLNVHQLFDIALHPKFAENGWVYLTYMKFAPGATTRAYNATTALARGKFDGTKLNDVKDVFVADAWSVNNGSDASRVVFAPDGTLYMSSSHRRTEDPQKLTSHIGKILRLNDDGSVPKDNPYVGNPNAKPEIYSMGHRTVLGLTIKPGSNQLWETENGPQGGDEVNIIKPSLNYGWPVVTYGRDYDGKRLGPQPWRADMEAPELFWVPSITASGITFYSGSKIPAWKDNLFVGSMTMGRIPGTGHIQRVAFNQNGEQKRELMLTDLHQRIRDIREGPDGFLYLLTDENDGAILRIEPAQ